MKTLLVAIDCSPASQRVIDVAGEIARAMRADVHLLHVREIQAALPIFAPGAGVFGVGTADMTPMSGVPVVLPDAMQNAPDKSQRAQLDAWREQLVAAQLNVWAHERTGDVVSEVIAAADELGADIVVLGSHGHGAMYNLLVGSAAAGLLKSARRPLLVVPIDENGR